MSRWLSSGQVARIFHVSPSTVRNWTNQGRLPTVRTLGGKFRYDPDQIHTLAATAVTTLRPQR